MQKLKILKDELKSYSILSIFLSLAAIGMIITVGFRIAFDSIFYINQDELSDDILKSYESENNNSKNNISIFDLVYNLIPKKIVYSYIISNIISFLFFVTFITNCVLSTQYKNIDTGSYIFNIIVQVLILILLITLTYLLYSTNIYNEDEAEKIAKEKFEENYEKQYSVVIKDENYKSFSFYINLIVVYIFSLILLLFSILSLNSHNRRKKLINPTPPLSTLHSSN